MFTKHTSTYEHFLARGFWASVLKALEGSKRSGGLFDGEDQMQSNSRDLFMLSPSKRGSTQLGFDNWFEGPGGLVLYQYDIMVLSWKATTISIWGQPCREYLWDWSSNGLHALYGCGQTFRKESLEHVLTRCLHMFGDISVSGGYWDLMLGLYQLVFTVVYFCFCRTEGGTPIRNLIQQNKSIANRWNRIRSYKHPSKSPYNSPEHTKLNLHCDRRAKHNYLARRCQILQSSDLQLPPENFAVFDFPGMCLAGFGMVFEKCVQDFQAGFGDVFGTCSGDVVRL